MHADRPVIANGFTLVEVLVALVVTSFLLAIVMNAAVQARERGRSATERRAAVMLADTLISQATIRPFAPGGQSGREGSLHWQLGETAFANDPRGLFVLSAVTVKISSERGVALFSAGTRKLKPVPVQ